MPEVFNNGSEISKMHFYCYKILPLVYTDALSYYEMLCQTQAKLNEVIDTVNGFGNDFYIYVDEKIAEVESRVDVKLSDAEIKMNALLKQMQEQVDKVTNDLEAAKQYVDQQLAEQMEWVKEQIINVNANVAKQILQLREYIDAGDSIQKAYTDEQIQRVIDMIPEITSTIVVNPITGKQQKIQDALNDIVNYLKYWGITAIEYDNSFITASEYDNKNLTAIQYDLYGKYYLYKDPRFYMFNPFNGLNQFYQEVIYQIIDNFHKEQALTATEYDAMELTATIYDSLGRTAYLYDFFGTTGTPAI